MPYYGTGESRDSYITGVRPGGRYGAPHDVNQRRDGLPENVFSYIRDGVQREERMKRNEDDARARIRLELLAGKGARRVATGPSPAQLKAMEQINTINETRDRHAALAELYKQEMEEWEEQLGDRGLAPKAV